MTQIDAQATEGGLLKPGRWLRLRVMGWMIVLTVALIALANIEPLGRLALHRPVGRSGPIGALAGVALAYAAYVGAVWRGERRRPAELALRPLPEELLYGLAIGAAMFALVFIILEWTGAYSLSPGGETQWLRAGAGALGAGLSEELVFRALIFRLLMRAFGPWWALLASAALFGAAHLMNPHASLMAGTAIAVEAGLMLAALYLVTGRLWLAVGAHVAWNFTQGTIFGAAVSGHSEVGALYLATLNRQRPDWLTGGDFGPEASLPAMLVGLAVFLLALLVWLRKRRGPAIVMRPAGTVVAAPPEVESSS